jgi:hypothetical protein
MEHLAFTPQALHGTQDSPQEIPGSSQDLNIPDPASKERGLGWLRLGRFSAYLSTSTYRPRGRLFEVERSKASYGRDVEVWGLGLYLVVSIGKAMEGGKRFELDCQGLSLGIR